MIFNVIYINEKSKRLFILCLLISIMALAACSDSSDKNNKKKSVRTSTHSNVTAIPLNILKISEAKIIEEIKHQSAHSVVKLLGEPTEKIIMPYRRNVELWRFRVDIKRSDGSQVDYINLLTNKGKYISAYGYRNPGDKTRRNLQLEEVEFSQLVMGKYSDQILDVIGEPDFYRVTADVNGNMSFGWIYDMWIIRDNEMFAGVGLYLNGEALNGYSFQQGGRQPYVKN